MTKQTEIIAVPSLDSANSLAEVIDRKLDGIREWLRENAPEIQDEQRHLDAESVERAYWHFGYAAALRDIKNCLPGKNDRVC